MLWLLWTPQYPWEKHTAELFGDDPDRGLGAEQLAMKAVRRRFPKACFGPLSGTPWVAWPEAAQHCQGWEAKAVEINVIFGSPHDGMVAMLVRLAAV